MGKKHDYRQKRKKRKTSSNTLVRPQKRNWRATINSLVVSFLVIVTIASLSFFVWPAYEFYSKENVTAHTGVVTDIYVDSYRDFLSPVDYLRIDVYIELDSNQVYCVDGDYLIDNDYEISTLKSELLGKQVKLECFLQKPTEIVTFSTDETEIISCDYFDGRVVESLVALGIMYFLIYGVCVMWFLIKHYAND